MIGEEKATLIPNDAPALRTMWATLERRGGAGREGYAEYSSRSLVIWPRKANAAKGHCGPAGIV